MDTELHFRYDEAGFPPPPPRLEPRAYVEKLAVDALNHRAIEHPYLRALGNGDLPNIRWALADFGRQYYGYSRYFPKYLTTTISRLERPEHREALQENLVEESGFYDEPELAELAQLGIAREWIIGIPHPKLFRRFCEAMGVDVDELQDENDQVVCWREMFLMVLATGSPAEAIGALGLGTENIVRHIYVPFVRAIKRVDISNRDSVFFPLHTAVDDHHTETLNQIAADLGASDDGRRDLRRGMLKALALRNSFWDWMYERALDPERADQIW